MPYPSTAEPGLALPGTMIPGQPGGAQTVAGLYRTAAIPGMMLPGSAVPGQPLNGVTSPAAAAFAAAGRIGITATAGPDLNALWVAYQRAYLYASSQFANWRMMRQAGGTDGTAGFLYGKAYEADRAADEAYAAFQAAQRLAYPGVTG